MKQLIPKKRDLEAIPAGIGGREATGRELVNQSKAASLPRSILMPRDVLKQPPNGLTRPRDVPRSPIGAAKFRDPAFFHDRCAPGIRLRAVLFAYANETERNTLHSRCQKKKERQATTPLRRCRRTHFAGGPEGGEPSAVGETGRVQRG